MPSKIPIRYRSFFAWLSDSKVDWNRAKVIMTHIFLVMQMAKSSRPHDLSRKLLLGVAVAAIPLAGCTMPETQKYRATAKPGASFSTSADEAALYDRARKSGNVVLAEEFLCKFPDSELIPSLLTRLPQPSLRRIDPKCVAGLNPATANALPASIKLALGLTSSRRGDGRNDSPSDGYSG